MKYFLQLVAEDLFQRYNNNMSRIALVFPNKRAGIFFDDYLSETNNGNPVWAPNYLTIDELVNSLSPLRAADDIETICRLHKIYQNAIGSKKSIENSLDYFYGWGERLMTDFNNIDKSMANAKDLLTNLSAIKELETPDLETQKRIEELFNPQTTTPNTNIRKSFIQLWIKLYDIYTNINAELEKLGQAYPGAQARIVANGLKSGKIQLSENYDTYVFIGFNQLLQTEKSIFSTLQKKHKALFYWDYDKLYFEENSLFAEVGQAIKENIKRFPNELKESCFDNFRKKKQIEFVATASVNAQAVLAANWISKNLTDEEKKTAIVLCDENLLQPVLHSLPGKDDNNLEHGKKVNEVNVTKGFPLNHTPAYAFVTNFFKDHIDSNLKNSELLIELNKSIRKKAQRESKINKYDTLTGQLATESFFQTYTTINRFLRLIEENLMDVSTKTLQRIIQQALRQCTIPFHGEPAEGLQVMGVLETRNLDFQNILLLSVNESIVPQPANDYSFIPYDLRKAYGLTTAKQKTSIYAYNFFRLLQRAEHITLAYDESTDGLHKGEMSRFMQQLLIGTNLDITCITLKENQITRSVEAFGISPKKSIELMKEQTSLSPSAINTYIDCPLKFFFQKIAYFNKIDKPEKFLASNTVGSIFHESAQLAYQELTQRSHLIVSSEIERLNNNMNLKNRLIAQAFKEVSVIDYYHQIRQSATDFDYFLSLCGLENIDEKNKLQLMKDKTKITHHISDLFERKPNFQLYKPTDYLIEYNVVLNYLTSLLTADKELDDLAILEMEKRHNITINGITIGGIIDRIDKITREGKPLIRILDYKTGAYNTNKVQAKDLETLVTPSKNVPHYILQTFIYSMIYHENNLNNSNKNSIAPVLFFTQKATNKEYNPYIKLGTYKDKNLHEILDFQQDVLYPKNKKGLRQLIEELLEKIKSQELVPTTIIDNCKNCDFKLLCNRK